MNHILLLLHDQSLAQTLYDWLTPRYDVALGLAEGSASQQFSLCITDLDGLAEHKDWIQAHKSSQRPVFFPVLCIVPRGEIKTALHPLWHVTDELIVQPLDQTELQTRLAALLRTRQISFQLHTSRERLLRVSKAIESTSDAISIADVDGAAIYHNQAFTDLFGYTVNELNVRGVPTSLFTRPAVALEIFETVRGGQSWRGEVTLKTKQDRRVPVLLRANAIEGDHGEHIGLISVYTDITERKRAERIQTEQRVLAEALVDTAAILTSTLDLDEVMDRILVNIGRVVPHDSAAVLLLENGVVHVVRARGFADDEVRAWIENLHFSLEQSDALNRQIHTGQPVIVSAIPEAVYDGLPWGLRSIRSYLGVPIQLKETATGFLYLLSDQEGFFTEVHGERLQAFAKQAAIAIQNAQLHGKAQELATIQERQRLARDLHDAVSQTLFSASVIAESLPRLWTQRPEKVAPRLEQLHRLTRGALAEMRTLLLELRPAALMEVQFDELLRHLTDALQGRTTLDVDLVVSGRRDLPEAVQTALYYIAQEALNNVVKHANAQRAQVRLESSPHQVELTIRDDGCGFDPAAARPSSLGLHIMRERAEGIHAILDVDTEQGRGTTVKVVWSENGRKGHA